MRPGAALAVIGALLSAAAAAGEKRSRIVQPPAGVFKLRKELVGQHPRLYFTKKDIPDLRRRVAGGRKWFVQRVKQSFGGRYGSGPKAKVAGWERYLFGFWGLVGADMLYLFEGDPKYRDIAKAWVRWNLSKTDWVKDDLIPMDILSGLSITYDMLYDEFTEAERKELRGRIFEAMKFIHGRFFVGQYWTGDYQNNHMHNRIHALANAAFAILGDDPELDAAPYADMAYDQFMKVVEWLPEDGSQHEGPGYWSYGHHWVVRTLHLMEHVTGEDIGAKNPHFASAHWYRIYMTAPGWKRTLGIGDAGDGPPGNLTTLCRPVAEAADGPGTTFIRRMMEVNAGQFYQHPAWGMLWYDASIEPRPLDEMPLWRFWPDVEMLSVRSSWQDDAAAFVFICGPPGGHKLQKLRGPDWANVAHDHPDQNHFLLFAHGALLAEDDGYPKQKKLTRSHNTISIDGKGGPREGTGWYQPFDYKRTATMRDVFCSGACAVATGDASRLYGDAQKAVRHVAFVDGEYVITFDDLVAAGGAEHDFEWRLHKDGDWKEAGAGHFTVTDRKLADVSLDIRFLLPAGGVKGRFLPAELTAKPCLAVAQRGKSARFVAVLVPRKTGAPEVAAELVKAAGCVAVTCSGPAHADIFAVAEGDRPAAFSAAEVKATGAAALVRLTKKGEVDSAMLVRGTSLAVGGRTLLASQSPVNLSWRRKKGEVVVGAEAPYGVDAAKLRKATVQIGGLRPMSAYPVGVDGRSAGRLKTDGGGRLRVPLDLSGRRRVTVGGSAASMRAPRSSDVPPSSAERPGADEAGAGDRRAAKLYRDARSAERAGMKELAKTLYERLISDFPDHRLAAKARERIE